MKRPKRRLLACLLAVMLCTAVFSTTAYADGGNYHGKGFQSVKS